MPNKMSLQLELFAAIADVASVTVKGNSSLENVQTSAGLESDRKATSDSLSFFAASNPYL